jgi:hypothetical protein
MTVGQKVKTLMCSKTGEQDLNWKTENIWEELGKI